MKTIPYSVPFALVASFALGATAVQTLHAQSHARVTSSPRPTLRATQTFTNVITLTSSRRHMRHSARAILYGKQSRSASKASRRADTL
jgi:hypothetical protein